MPLAAVTVCPHSVSDQSESYIKYDGKAQVSLVGRVEGSDRPFYAARRMDLKPRIQAVMILKLITIPRPSTSTAKHL